MALSGQPFSNTVRQTTVLQQTSAGRHVSSAARRSRSRRSAVASSMFRDTSSRFAPEEQNVSPPVGTYNIGDTWRDKDKTIVRMVPSPSIHSIAPGEAPSPGPGHYEIPRSPVVLRPNRKDIMVSTGGRYEIVPVPVPGPGYYDPVPLLGSMITPSHNALTMSV